MPFGEKYTRLFLDQALWYNIFTGPSKPSDNFSYAKEAEFAPGSLSALEDSLGTSQGIVGTPIWSHVLMFRAVEKFWGGSVAQQ